MYLIPKAFGILSILSLLIYVLGYMSLEMCILYEIGKYHILNSSMLNYFSILYMYMDPDNSNNLISI